MADAASQISVDQAANGRLGVAIIANSQTPYRLHLHQRIAREMPQIKLHSLFTHDQSNADWEFSDDAEIGTVRFGRGESSRNQSLWKYALREWRRGGRIIRWLKDNSVRCVIVMGYNDAGRVRIMRWCRDAGVACFLFGDSNIDGDNATGLKRWAKQRVVRRIVSWCTGILCCGDKGKAYFLRYGAKPESIFFFPYEPDYEQIWSVTRGEIEAAMARFGLRPGQRRLVFSGRLSRVKRPDLVIDGFNQIATARANWDLVMIGSGELEAALRAAVKPDLRERIVWTGFIDDQRLISAIYRACDCLVLPSDYEPWALVINEAAAAGLAIISSQVVGAANELVRDGLNGRVFKAGDEVGLVNALLDVTDPGNIERYKAASAGVLAGWRERGDPVKGLKEAMSFANLCDNAGYPSRAD